MAWGRGRGEGREGAEGVDVDYAPPVLGCCPIEGGLAMRRILSGRLVHFAASMLLFASTVVAAVPSSQAGMG